MHTRFISSCAALASIVALALVGCHRTGQATTTSNPTPSAAATLKGPVSMISSTCGPIDGSAALEILGVTSLKGAASSGGGPGCRRQGRKEVLTSP